MPRWLPIAAVVLALLGVAAYGLLRPGTVSGRDPADVQRMLAGLPRQIGPWLAGEDQVLSDRTVNTGRFEAYLSRVYTDPTSREAVSVMVLYGETGDIGAHDPRVCYAGSGYALDGQPAKAAVAESDGGKRRELWSARFRKQEESLQVYWGWGADGEWRAADNPRFTFANHRRLYKLYAQQVLTGGTPSWQGGKTASPTVADPLAAFLPKFLDVFDDAERTP